MYHALSLAGSLPSASHQSLFSQVESTIISTLAGISNISRSPTLRASEMQHHVVVHQALFFPVVPDVLHQVFNEQAPISKPSILSHPGGLHGLGRLELCRDLLRQTHLSELLD